MNFSARSIFDSKGESSTKIYLIAFTSNAGSRPVYRGIGGLSEGTDVLIQRPKRGGGAIFTFYPAY